jgi:hypothetical protein
MPGIDDYEMDLQRALIDAAAEPALRPYIDAADLETRTIDLGDGSQAQVQAIAADAVKRVIERLVTQARKAGADLKTWICSPDEFNLCARLGGRTGDVMRQLHAFLNRKWAQGGLNAAALAALFTLPGIGAALTIFSALGFINNVFVELCDCSLAC